MKSHSLGKISVRATSAERNQVLATLKHEDSDTSMNESSQPIFTNSEYSSSDYNSDDNGAKSLPILKKEEDTAKSRHAEVVFLYNEFENNFNR